jgi:hypothetical protein
MAEFNRGTKRRCSHCGAPFYDLTRTPIVCPKCNQEWVAPTRAPAPTRMPRTHSAAVIPLPVADAAEDVDQFAEDEVLADELPDEDEADVDADELDEEVGEPEEQD